MLNVIARLIDAKLNLLTEAETEPETALRKRTLLEASREAPSQETSSSFSLSPDVIVSTCDFKLCVLKY